MHPRLLEYYNAELTYMRELAQEFAEQHPKIAARLGMNGVEVADPYVERLLQGFSFLSARIQLKMDEQFPHFSQRLLEVLYPHYLAPTPSVAIVQLHPRMSEGSLAEGFQIPRLSPMSSNKLTAGSTACEFRTAHDVTLWPLEILQVSCTGAPADLPLANLRFDNPVKGAIRICLTTIKGKLSELALDQLTFHLAGADDIASHLYEAIFAHALGVVGCETQRPVKWMEFLYPDCIHAEGFDSDQALIPFDKRAFQGYRLLHEYFTLPARYRFFTLTGLKKCIDKAEGTTLDLTILLDCPAHDLESRVDKRQLALFCTPVVNLFSKRSNAVEINAHQRETRIVADKNKALDFEVYSVSAAFGQETEGGNEQEFRSFYATRGTDEAADASYYALRREPSIVPEALRRSGMRTNYVGSDVYASLVDRNQAPFQHALKSLSFETLCTNRDLPLSIPRTGPSDFKMKASVPVESIKIVHGPTEPKPALAQGIMAWRIISHLDVNALTLTDLNEDEGPQALRELLSIYGTLAGPGQNKQIEAIRHCRIKQVAHILPDSALGYGYGARVDLTIDETLFGGTSPYLFGAVLEQFFARHVSQHSFTETALRSTVRGEIACWKPRMGKRPIA